MPYNEKLAKRIRQRLSALNNIEEKKMMGGLVFMYNGKMCVGIMKNDLMCRIDPAFQEKAARKKGCSVMELGKRLMKGYVVINDSGMKAEKDFNYWIDLSLEFNPKAKASKKK